MSTGRLPTPDGHHRTEVRANFGGIRGADGYKRTTYVAHCESCGWTGRPMDTGRDAENDADEHASMMAGE